MRDGELSADIISSLVGKSASSVSLLIILGEDESNYLSLR